MTGLGMVGVIGVNYRIFKTLAENGISVFLVSQASSENSTSIGVRNEDAALACKVLDEEFAKEIEMGEISPMKAEGGACYGGYRRREHETYAGHRRKAFRYTGTERHQCDSLCARRIGKRISPLW